MSSGIFGEPATKVWQCEDQSQNQIATVYEFPDGTVDIQLSPLKASERSLGAKRGRKNA